MVCASSALKNAPVAQGRGNENEDRIMSASRTHRPHHANRPSRPATPPAIELMDSTHRETQHVLLEMIQLADLLAQARPGSAAAALAVHICEFFNGPVREHHESEETQVFPGLLAGGDVRVREHVQRLQQDHMWLEEDWLELEPHLQAVARGYETDHRQFLSTALPEFVELCSAHMALEESLAHPGLVAPSASDSRC